MAADWCEHLTFGVIYNHPACGECPTQTELEHHALFFLAALEYHRQHPKQPGEEWYEFWREYQEVDMSELEIQRLADFFITRYPREIGAGDPKHGESAVDVAIRMIARMTDGIDRSLRELGTPDDDPVTQRTRITEILLNALGPRGRDQTPTVVTLRTSVPLTPDQAMKQHIRFSRVYEGSLGPAKAADGE